MRAHIVEWYSIIYKFFVLYLNIVQIHNYGRKPIVKNGDLSPKGVIDMKWKMFGLGGKLGSTKERVFSLIRGIGMRDLNASSDANEDLRQPKSFNPQVYMLAKRRMHEIEGQKAMIIHELRHEFWKAGGPV